MEGRWRRFHGPHERPSVQRHREHLGLLRLEAAQHRQHVVCAQHGQRERLRRHHQRWRQQRHRLCAALLREQHAHWAVCVFELGQQHHHRDSGGRLRRRLGHRRTEHHCQGRAPDGCNDRPDLGVWHALEGQFYQRDGGQNRNPVQRADDGKRGAVRDYQRFAEVQQRRSGGADGGGPAGDVGNAVLRQGAHGTGKPCSDAHRHEHRQPDLRVPVRQGRWLQRNMADAECDEPERRRRDHPGNGRQAQGAGHLCHGERWQPADADCDSDRDEQHGTERAIPPRHGHADADGPGGR